MVCLVKSTPGTECWKPTMVLIGPSARCQGDRGACVLMCTLMTDSGCLPEALLCANEEIHGRHCHSPSVMSEQSGEWTGVGTKAAIKCRVYRPASAQFLAPLSPLWTGLGHASFPVAEGGVRQAGLR